LSPPVATGAARRKTRGSKKTLDLPPLAAQLLREQLLARWYTSSGLVSLAPEGRIWNKDNFTARVFRPAVGKRQKALARARAWKRRADPFDGATFHDLRHACASLLIAAANRAGAGQAVTVKSIAEQLGHTGGASWSCAGVVIFSRALAVMPRSGSTSTCDEATRRPDDPTRPS
jgi:integrase